MAEQAAAGAGLLVNLNASPYSQGRRHERLSVLADRVEETGCPIVYVNQVGGQDELVFDGASVIVGPDGSVVASAGQFTEQVLLVDLDVADPRATGGADRARCRGQDGRGVHDDTGVGRRPPPPERWHRCSIPRPRCTRRWCSGPATTWPRTGSPTP